MYPFKVVIIGEDEQLLPQVRRELLNQWATVDTEFRDLAAAMEQLSLERDDLRLFVIHIADVEGLDALRHFSRVFPGHPILLLVMQDANSSHVVHAMRNGASQVVTLPLSAEDLSEALDGILTQYGNRTNRGGIITITGGHGGAGTTSLAVNLAYEAAQHYQRETILLELQPVVGSLSSFLGIEPKHSTEELLQHGQAVDDCLIRSALTPYGNHLSILAGPLHASARLHPDNHFVPHLIKCTRRLAEVVIVDVPAAIDDSQLATLRLADKVVLVAEQTIPSLHLTREMLLLGLRAFSPTVVINRYDSTLKGFGVEHLKQVLDVENLRTIVDDPAGFHAALNGGQPLRLASPKSKAIADISAITQWLLDLKAAGNFRGAPEGIVSRLSHLLSGASLFNPS